MGWTLKALESGRREADSEISCSACHSRTMLMTTQVLICSRAQGCPQPLDSDSISISVNKWFAFSCFPCILSCRVDAELPVKADAPEARVWLMTGPSAPVHSPAPQHPTHGCPFSSFPVRTRILAQQFSKLLVVYTRSRREDDSDALTEGEKSWTNHALSNDTARASDNDATHVYVSGSCTHTARARFIVVPPSHKRPGNRVCPILCAFEAKGSPPDGDWNPLVIT